MSIFPSANWSRELRRVREELELEAQTYFGPIVNINDLSNNELREIIDRYKGGIIARARPDTSE